MRVDSLPPPLKTFVRELQRAGGNHVMEPMAEAFTGLDGEANDGNEDAENLLIALGRVSTMPWSIVERLSAMHDLLRQRPPGRTIVTFRGNEMIIESRLA
jgi:hypothetical protein